MKHLTVLFLALLLVVVACGLSQGPDPTVATFQADGKETKILKENSHFNVRLYGENYFEERKFSDLESAVNFAKAARYPAVFSPCLTSGEVVMGVTIYSKTSETGVKVTIYETSGIYNLHVSNKKWRQDYHLGPEAKMYRLVCADKEEVYALAEQIEKLF